MKTIEAISVLCDKIARRGWRWFWVRLGEKLVDPTSRIGGVAGPAVHGLRKLRAPAQPGRSSSAAKTLFLFYDLQVLPITFNAIDDLAAAEIIRRRRGLDDIQVVIVPGRHDGLRWEDEEYDSIVNRDVRYWRLHNIVIAAFALLPRCTGYTLCSSRAEAADLLAARVRHVYPAGYTEALPVATSRRPVMEWARAGEPVFPVLTSTPEALRLVQARLEVVAGGRRVIVITLRNYGYGPQRNSRTEEWAAFARSLDPSRYVVIFVPDTEAALGPTPDALRDFPIMPEAAFNLQLRMALYELAWLNMALMHGPMELCWYNEKCRYIILQIVDSSPQTSRAVLLAEGYDIGGQLPWAKPYQKWVWKPDRLEVLQRHFRDMESLLERLD